MEFAAFLDALLRVRLLPVENVVVLAKVDSTNTLARRLATDCLAESHCLHPGLVVAFEQTAGKGRRGRRWESPPGAGVYATYLLPLTDRRDLATLPLLAGVGLCRVLNRLLGVGRCRLKWPNDLVVGERKLGGLLIELHAAEDEAGAAVIGFGVNCSQGEGELPLETATSLRLAGARRHAPAEILWDLVEGLTAELARLGDEVYAAAEYARLSAHSEGDRLCCRLGGELVEGTFSGFDSRGFLRLRVHDGRERLLSAGEVLSE